MTSSNDPTHGPFDDLPADRAADRAADRPADRQSGVVNPTADRLPTVAAATRARDEAMALEARTRFLSEASRVLGSSLDSHATLESVARLAVPMLGDWCVVDVLGDDGRVRRVAVENADPANAAVARALERVDPRDMSPPCGAPHVFRTGLSELAPEVTEAHLAAVAPHPEQRALLRALGVCAQMCVPLIVRGRTIGALTLMTAESGRGYGPDDLALAEALAERAALAVDNARLYREVARANAAKAEFLATMSHEFRTPLHVVMGYAELLHAGIPEPIPEGAREQVARIRAAADHLLHLVDQVLSFSRLEARREAVRAEPVNVAALARQLVLLAEPLAQAKGLCFVVQASDDEMAIVTDGGKLRQILYNLLANAVKFTARGDIALTARREHGEGGEHIVLEVRDTGIGIDPADLDRIFDAFWQVAQTEQPAGSATGKPGGAGLGLSISRRLARLLGGELSVTSTVGEGTTFVLSLPLVYDPRLLHDEEALDPLD